MRRGREGVCDVRGAGKEVERGRARKNGRGTAREGYQGGGEGMGSKGGGRGVGGAQGADVLVCVSLQEPDTKFSALHAASFQGLVGTVAQLLSHGADAALKDKVRALHASSRGHTHIVFVYSLGAYIPLCYK